MRSVHKIYTGTSYQFILASGKSFLCIRTAFMANHCTPNLLNKVQSMLTWQSLEALLFIAPQHALLSGSI